MSCKIIYNNQNYTIESFKDYLVKNKNLFLQDFISQDIEGFKEFVNNDVSLPDDLLKAQEIDNSITPEVWSIMSEEDKINWFKCNKK